LAWRLTELIAYAGMADDEWIVFHVVPARKKFLSEMGFDDMHIRQFLGRR
jgi:hypothetical protein